MTPQPQTSSAKDELQNLDFLRSVAVLIVVTAHTLMYLGFVRHIGLGFIQNFFPWMGTTGVCLFFVHTCLVLMWSLERDSNSGRFYIRRIFRLFPLWLVVLTAVVVLRMPIAPPAAPGFQYFPVSIGEFVANATMTFNIWYGPKIVGASWSLPIEAQMYILLPVLFFFVRSTRSLWVLLAIDALVIVSVWSVLDYHVPTESTLAMCIPYFLPGVMAYVLTKKVKQALPAWSFVLYLLALSVLECRYGNELFASFFCLAIGIGIPFFRQVTWRPLVRASHVIARYSYGIYLCHIPSICIGVYYLRNHSWFLRLASIPALIALFSVILYKGIEAPMIRFGSKLAKKIEGGRPPRVDESVLSVEPAP